VGEVDSEDDAIWRWVIHHYRFDPERGERRNVVVAAYDNEREFEMEFERYNQRVRSEINAGARSEFEHVSGVTRHPGYHAEQARAHLVRHAIEHGVDPRPRLQGGKLPSNVSIASFSSDVADQPSSCGDTEVPEPPPEAPC
jgi:hypothetical protein